MVVFPDPDLPTNNIERAEEEEEEVEDGEGEEEDEKRSMREGGRCGGIGIWVLQSNLVRQVE